MDKYLAVREYANMLREVQLEIFQKEQELRTLESKAYMFEGLLKSWIRDFKS